MPSTGRNDETTATLQVRVQPRASREGVQPDNEGGVRVTVSAAPVDGAANLAVCACVAKYLGLPKNHVTLEHGERSRTKRLRIRGLSQTQLDAALNK